MFKHYFKGIEGIASYPMVLLVIFLLFFTGMIVYLWKSDKTFMKKMSEMPLSEDNQDSYSSKLKNASGL